MAKEMTATAKREIANEDRGETTRPTAIFVPDTDVYETEDQVVVVADMPGVAPDGVDVTLERRVLTIRGHVPSEAHDDYRRIHAEYGQGDFERVFTLSEEIDRDRIEASHKNGVLTLKMPKAASAKTQKIRVKAA